MGWLIGPTLFAIFLAVVAVKIYEFVFPYVLSGVTGSLVSVTKAGLFIVTWTAVTTTMGMRGFSQKVKHLRRGNQKAIKALSMGERP